MHVLNLQKMILQPLTPADSLIEMPVDGVNDCVTEALSEPHDVEAIRLAVIPFAPDGTTPLPLNVPGQFDPPLPMPTPFCNQVL